MKNSEKFELISALIDGESNDDNEMNKTLELLYSETLCQEKWKMYYTIRNSMRENHSTHQSLNINNDQSSNIRIFGPTNFWLPLVAGLSVLGLGFGWYFNYFNHKNMPVDDSFYNLSQDNEKDNSDNDEFLKVYEYSTNRGGMIRVSFPGENQ